MRNLPVLDRREFLSAAAITVAAALAPTLTGCAASNITHGLVPSNGKLRLKLSDYPTLSEANGSARILPEGFKNPLYVLVNGDGTYTTLSSVCTHRGCTVNVEGDRLVCPCHGAIFDRGGEVLDGPAPTALPKYPTSVSRGVLTIVVGNPS